MKKIRLDPDSLEVMSFATDAASARRGTVRGRESFAVEEPDHKYPFTQWPSCDRDCAFQTFEFDSCDGADTCGQTCDWPCRDVSGGIGDVGRLE